MKSTRHRNKWIGPTLAENSQLLDGSLLMSRCTEYSTPSPCVEQSLHRPRALADPPCCQPLHEWSAQRWEKSLKTEQISKHWTHTFQLYNGLKQASTESKWTRQPDRGFVCHFCPPSHRSRVAVDAAFSQQHVHLLIGRQVTKPNTNMFSKNTSKAYSLLCKWHFGAQRN